MQKEERGFKNITISTEVHTALKLVSVLEGKNIKDLTDEILITSINKKGKELGVESLVKLTNKKKSKKPKKTISNIRSIPVEEEETTSMKNYNEVTNIKPSEVADDMFDTNISSDKETVEILNNPESIKEEVKQEIKVIETKKEDNISFNDKSENFIAPQQKNVDDMFVQEKTINENVQNLTNNKIILEEKTKINEEAESSKIAVTQDNFNAESFIVKKEENADDMFE